MVTEKEFFNDGGIRITNSKLSFRADDGSLRTYLIANLDGYGTVVVAPNWNSWIGLHFLFLVFFSFTVSFYGLPFGISLL